MSVAVAVTVTVAVTAAAIVAVAVTAAVAVKTKYSIFCAKGEVWQKIGHLSFLYLVCLKYFYFCTYKVTESLVIGELTLGALSSSS